MYDMSLPPPPGDLVVVFRSHEFFFLEMAHRELARKFDRVSPSLLDCKNVLNKLT